MSEYYYGGLTRMHVRITAALPGCVQMVGRRAGEA